MADNLPVAPFKKLLKETGFRVSDEAAEALAELVEDIGFIVAEEAINVARENKRKTVTKEDIEEAKKRIW